MATCGTYDELIATVEATEPEVVTTDIRMPPSQTDEGIRAAHHLSAVPTPAEGERGTTDTRVANVPGIHCPIELL